MSGHQHKIGDTIQICIPVDRIERTGDPDWDWRKLAPTVTVTLMLIDDAMVALANREDFDGLYYGYACATGTGFIRLETDYVNAEKENK